MPLYKLPDFKKFSIKIDPSRITQLVVAGLLSRVLWGLIGLIILPSVFGFLAGFAANTYFYQDIKDYLTKLSIDLPDEERLQEGQQLYIPQTSQEQTVIQVVKQATDAVVSVVAAQDVPVFEEEYINPFEGSPLEEFFPELGVPQRRQLGTEKREISAGTGFIVSDDGLILTNKHVVSIKDADYTVYTNDGQKFPAKVFAIDPVQDLAILKIELQQPLPTLTLGDSSKLQIGQTAVTIGNALGEFRNTVSVGVISGLSRTITAQGAGLSETIEDVLQTDAAINEGNSGGPLLNLRGEVVGINTAIVTGAQNIGFAIPINSAKRDIEQVKTLGKISYAYLGVWYGSLTPDLQKQYGLPIDYGAWIGRDGRGRPTKEAVIADAPADKAGLKKDDIIAELNGEKIDQNNSLSKIIQKYNPGDKAILKIFRDGKEITLEVVLGER